jgi:hypothetical protein
MPPEHISLVEKLFTWPTSDSLEDEWKRRNEAVEAVRLYCGFPEGGPLWGRPKRAVPLDDDEDQDMCPPTAKKREGEQPTLSTWDAKLSATKEHIEKAPKPKTCFQCFKKYSDHNGVKRHFRTSHLEDRKCNYCDVALLHQMHLQSHAEQIHRLRT